MRGEVTVNGRLRTTSKILLFYQSNENYYKKNDQKSTLSEF